MTPGGACILVYDNKIYVASAVFSPSRIWTVVGTDKNIGNEKCDWREELKKVAHRIIVLHFDRHIDHHTRENKCCYSICGSMVVVPPMPISESMRVTNAL